MRVLVTGGAGFIGSHIVGRLLTAGVEVRVLDGLLTAAHGTAPTVHQPADAEFCRGDLRDADTVAGAMTGVDAVCHQAAMVGLGLDLGDLPDYVSCNDLGTAVLLRAMAAAGVRRLVLASSMVVYGEGRYVCAGHGTVRPGPRAAEDLAAGRFEPRCPECGCGLSMGAVPEDERLDPRNVYAATKVAQEHLASAWARVVGGEVIALRYHNVYGPGMPKDTPYAGVAAIFRSALAAGRPPQVFEDGAQRRDFVHVADVARANLLALEAVTGREFTAYNIASGDPHTVGQMAEALAAAYGGPAPEVTGQYRLGDVRHIVADAELARRGLGFAAGVPFAEGMRELATAVLRGAG